MIDSTAKEARREDPRGSRKEVPHESHQEINQDHRFIVPCFYALLCSCSLRLNREEDRFCLVQGGNSRKLRSGHVFLATIAMTSDSKTRKTRVSLTWIGRASTSTRPLRITKNPAAKTWGKWSWATTPGRFTRTPTATNRNQFQDWTGACGYAFTAVNNSDKDFSLTYVSDSFSVNNKMADPSCFPP